MRTRLPTSTPTTFASGITVESGCGVDFREVLEAETERREPGGVNEEDARGRRAPGTRRCSTPTNRTSKACRWRFRRLPRHSK